MKVLVTGYTGQLGYDVVREGKNIGFDMYGIGSKDLDITSESDVLSYVNKIKPDAVIHCAAYTAVDNAEENQVECQRVNVEGTRYLVKAAKKVNAKFIYISTDYVFSGEGTTPFSEYDQTNPINYYGLTKLEGERIVEAELKKWFVVRTSWVFGMNGSNFVKTMLRLSKEYDELNVVDDQIGSPTYTYDLARLLIRMIQTDKYGVYHGTNEGFCSWYEFAVEIFKLSGENVTVKPISSTDYQTNARRPMNSRLSKEQLYKNDFKLLPAWQDAVKRYIQELKKGENNG